MANLERNNKILLDLVRQPGNNMCADCGAPGKYTNQSVYILTRTLVLFHVFFTFQQYIFPLLQTITPELCVKSGFLQVIVNYSG